MSDGQMHYGTQSLRKKKPWQKGDINKYPLVFDWHSRWVDLLEVLETCHCPCMNGKHHNKDGVVLFSTEGCGLSDRSLAALAVRIQLHLP